MIVRSYGIAIEAGNSSISLGDLFASLEMTSGQESNLLTNVRIIFLDTKVDKDFYVGLVVTVKDQKTYCELVKSQGKIKFNVVNLENNLMEFNFFLINKSSGIGIYQHYHHSCSPGSFFNYLRARYRDLSTSQRDKKIEEAKKSKEFNGKIEKLIRSNHSGALKVGTLTHKLALSKVLQKFKRIKGFEYEVVSIESEVEPGVPVSNYATKAFRRFTFSDTPVATLSNAIQKTVTALGIVKGHVNVIDEVDDEDVPMSVKISNIPESFGEHDFDTTIGLLNNMEAGQFAGHAITKQLLAICKTEHPEVFMQKVKGIKGVK